jgi:hypothetical protein
MKGFPRVLIKTGIVLLAFGIGLLVSLKSGDIINHTLIASGYHSRDFLAHVRFIVAFIVPFLMWLAVLAATIPVAHHMRRQLRLYGGMGFGVAALAGELLAIFVFLVRYV